ncbi:MAG: UDP-N-acetylmuramate dehydrogenase [Candidatus Omnitrophota bacterium]|nr:UDP-N-acetylmuramate dehydrogenase [Candidatus Omnitrophota bacterium]
MNWWKKLRGKLKIKEPIKKHTTLGIGGKAKYFIEPFDERELSEILKFAKQASFKVRLIGAGSNILSSDKPWNGIVIKLAAKNFTKLLVKKTHIIAGAGAGLGSLVKKAKENNLTGAEFLAGIPGTIGGAVFMNAGIKDLSMADLVEKIRVMDYNGNVMILDRKKIVFSYRESGLNKYIILAVVFRFKSGRRQAIEGRIARYLVERRLKQDWRNPSAGCVFKNPPGKSAGQLIDICGLKGLNIGGAQVSYKHANFIINKGGANSTDVATLMRRIKREIKCKFRVNLYPEIVIWD